MKVLMRRGLSIITAVAIMMTMCFGGIGVSAAYAAETEEPEAVVALSIYRHEDPNSITPQNMKEKLDGVEPVATFTMDDLKAIAEKEGNKKYDFSGYNTFTTYKTVMGDEGATFSGVLKEAGITLKQEELVKIFATDTFNGTFSGKDLTEKRYYYPKGMETAGTGKACTEAAYEGKVEVPAIISTAERGNGTFRFGQVAPNEQNYALFIQQVGTEYQGADGQTGGKIIIGGKAGKYDAATALTDEHGTPVTDTIEAGNEIRIKSDNNTRYLAKTYYSLDGSDPTDGSCIYDYHEFAPQDTKYPSFDKEGEDVTLKVRICGYGNEDSDVATFNFKVVPAAAPGVVKGLTAEGADWYRVKLTWDAVEFADGYTIALYDEETGEFVDKTSVAKSSLSGTAARPSYTFSDLNSLKQETEYTFKVKAYKKIGDDKLGSEEYSEAASAATLKMKAPTNLKATSNSYNSVKLTWSTTYGANGYKIFRTEAGKDEYAEVADVPAKSPYQYIDTDLKTETEYTYKIQGYRAYGEDKLAGDFSTEASAALVMSVPENLEAANADYDSVKLTWNEATGADGYKIYRYDAEKDEYVEVGDAEGTAYTDKGLRTGSEYTYKIKAYQAFKEEKVLGGYSEKASATPVMSVPGNFKAARASYNSIKLTWSKVNGADGYMIYRYDSAKKAYKPYKLITKGSTVSYTNTGISTGKEYSYKIRAYISFDDDDQYSKYSSVEAATPTLTTPTITKMTKGSRSITVKWNKIAGAHGYKVYRATSKTGTYKLLKTTSSTSITNKSLKKGQKYYYKVKAYRTVSGSNKYSNYSSVKYATAK